MTYSDNYNRRLLAEIYDQAIVYQDDVALLLSLIAADESLNILECFAGTGRISLPLLLKGHTVTCIELASAMAERARAKARMLGPEHDARLVIKVQDALGPEWGINTFDVVVIGGNALFELTTKEMQQACINRAYQALRPGGHLFLDNGNWTRPLELEIGRKWVTFEGVGSDGTYARQTGETTGVDTDLEIMYIQRTWYTRTIEGLETSETYMGCKRPVNGQEVEMWLKQAGFLIVNAYGNSKRSPLTKDSERAIFWAQKPE